MLLILLVFSWLVFACTAGWFWRRLQKRLYFNELQQAQTDSFMGSQRDMLEDIRRHVQRVDKDLRAHVDQWTTDSRVLEDSIDGLRFGLSEIGGFVRYNELYKPVKQRSEDIDEDMDARHAAPCPVYTTDPTTPMRPTASSAAPSSSVVRVVPREVRTGVYMCLL